MAVILLADVWGGKKTNSSLTNGFSLENVDCWYCVVFVVGRCPAVEFNFISILMHARLLSQLVLPLD